MPDLPAPLAHPRTPPRVETDADLTPAEIASPDPADAVVAALVGAVADARERLVELARDLRGHPQVVQTWSSMDCRGTLAGPALEWRVEAELRGGALLTWLVEACLDGGEWAIEATATLDRDREQRVLAQPPARLAPVSAIGPGLAAAVDELVSSAPAERVRELAGPEGGS